MTDTTDIQREKIAKGNPLIDLADSCRIDNGIFALEASELTSLESTFDQEREALDICFFTPASGSGSRMFSDLYNFLKDNGDVKGIEMARTLVLRIEELALHTELSAEWKSKLKSVFELQDFIQHLLGKEEMNLGVLPKGLIPFHKYQEFTTTAFQEHLIQGRKIGGSQAKFHFTINQLFKEQIRESVEELEKRDATVYDYTFSEQNPLTHSTAFDENLEILRSENGNLVLRPAGHGTLIHNLNAVDADLIFVRNIDNMQHLDRAHISIKTRKSLAGALLQFQADSFNILRKIERGNAFESSMKAFNDKYDMRISEELIANEEFVKSYLNRPLRIAGMVKNEGAPGGGPFWVNENGHLVRQIIESSQISNDPAQIQLMETATHFNPVELVCGVKDYKGTKFDLEQFVNPELYFIVKKTHEGQRIQYIEQPGLWNGGMAHWLTLFYEIDSDCFSPVKTVLDLLAPLHQGK